jgi:Phosphotransferase enzyme family
LLAPDFAQQVFAPLLQAVPSGDMAQRFLVLSGNGQPRWILPAQRRKLDSVLADWSPYRLDSRLKWRVVRTASRIGCLSLLPGMTISTVAGFDSIDWKSVGWTGCTPPLAAVYLGTPGPSRKAVIHLLDSSSGDCQVVVKVPISDGAHAAILREADVLSSLAEERCSFAPRLLSVDRERGISAQTVVPGVAGSRRLLPEYLRLLRSLRLPGETTSVVEHAATLQEQVPWSAASERELATMTAALTQLCDAHLLAAFWVHGDFAPWNIKHRSDGPPALLDWEEARRNGLPLQDAFHFLHIQDYLFGKRPTSHAESLNHFADELGLRAAQCRQLEIAYLVHSYLQRLTQRQLTHSDFLLDTIRVVLGEDQRPAPHFSLGCSPLTSPESSPSPAALHIRSDLFSAVIAQFNRAELPYCILSGYEEYPDRIPSDVDLMVRAADMPRMYTLLAQAAEGCGARILQAIQHETSACYFVLAKESGRKVGFLNPDCCSDYRRQGRLWLRADAILAARRSFNNFYVPSVPDEFIYYLIKKILKRSMHACHLRRLHGLYQRAPHDCGDWLHRFWSARTADALKRALVEQDLSWFATNSESLLSEIEASRPVERPLARFASRLRRVAGFVRRLLQPTGMCLVVSGPGETQAWNLATALQQSLEPAFRRTSALNNTSTQSCHNPTHSLHESRLAQYREILTLSRVAIKIRVARMRSTLAIRTVDHGELASGGKHRLASMFTRLMLRPDLVLVLSSGHRGISNAASGQGNSLPEVLSRSVSYLDGSLSMEDSVYQASRVILQWLSTRQVRRLSPDKGPSAPSEAPFSRNRTDLPDLQCRKAE